MRIASNDFLSFCQSLEGKQIPSRAGRTRFLVRLADNGLVFILPSGASRPESLRKVDVVLDRFDQTESFTTTDYLDYTVNVSYMLTLIEGTQLWVDKMATLPDSARLERIRAVLRDAHTRLHARIQAHSRAR